MRMAQADDTGEAEPCQVERRMSTIDHDVKVRHGQSNAAADTHDQPVAEWREVGYEHRWAWLVLPIALGRATRTTSPAFTCRILDWVRAG